MESLFRTGQGHGMVPSPVVGELEGRQGAGGEHTGDEQSRAEAGGRFRELSQNDQKEGGHHKNICSPLPEFVSTTTFRCKSFDELAMVRKETERLKAT
jgi:hypothetical protein